MVRGEIKIPKHSQQMVEDKLMAFVQEPDYTLNWKQIPLGSNNELVSSAHFEFGLLSGKVSYLTIDDSDNSQFSIPEDVVNKPRGKDNGMAKLKLAGFNLKTKPFQFEFTDITNSSNTLLSSDGGSFIMMKRYNQLDLVVPSKHIFGLGERTTNLTIGEGAWTLWADGQEPKYDTGVGDGQSYGVHPFALVQTAVPGRFIGLFFRSSNAMTFLVKHQDDKAKLTYISTGGQIEIYFMLKGSAKDIIKQYQEIVGKPSLPPVWALGWHTGYQYTLVGQQQIKTMVFTYHNK